MTQVSSFQAVWWDSGWVDISPVLRAEDGLDYSARNLLGCFQTPLSSVLNGQTLCLLAEGTGGLEVLNFEITFCITFIIAVLHPVNQIPEPRPCRGSIKGQLDPRAQSQDATEKAVGREKLLFLKGWQNIVLCFTNHLSHCEFTAGLISVSSWGLTFSRSS